MGGGAGYAEYQAAWKRVGGRAAALPASALAMKEEVPVRGASAEPVQTQREQFRNAGDLLRKTNQFYFLPCACGTTIKLPPEFTQDHVNCPRCGRKLTVPVAQAAAMAEIADVVARRSSPRDMSAVPSTPPTGRRVVAAAPLTITRHPGQWESFRCTCGNTVTLSAAFDAPQTTCGACGREVEVRSSES
jgi:hypothetical protein